jgi:hypothetical protein
MQRLMFLSELEVVLNNHIQNRMSLYELCSRLGCSSTCGTMIMCNHVDDPDRL